MPRPFLKMHGLGNDFVILDSRVDGFIPDEAACRRIADRKRGVGCDQIMILCPPESPEADLFMHMRNSDGSLVRACGNATRCVARLLFEETGKKEGVIQTVAGLLKVWETPDNLIAADFGEPRLDWQDIPLAQEADTLHVPLRVGELEDPCCVNVGNPHAVFFVADAEAVPLATLGPQLETHAIFPDRANIEVAQILSSNHIRMRVWERGAGITQACGSGACATLIAAVRRGLADRQATLTLDGGDLAIHWRDDGHIIMAGPTALSFRGEMEEELLGKNGRSSGI